MICHWHSVHYNEIIMSAMASQITSLTTVYSTIYSCADQRKHQRSSSLTFVRGIHWWPVNSPHKWPVTRKKFSYDHVIMDSLKHLRCQWCGALMFSLFSSMLTSTSCWTKSRISGDSRYQGAHIKCFGVLELIAVKIVVSKINKPLELGPMNIIKYSWRGPCVTGLLLEHIKPWKLRESQGNYGLFYVRHLIP